MDWAVDTTSVTCCGQEAQPVSDTSGGRSGTRSCWWMVDQICTDPVLPPTPECVVLRTLLQLTCMWNANRLCPSRVFPVQRVWCHTESLCSSDSPCISCTAHPDAGSHDEVAHSLLPIAACTRVINYTVFNVLMLVWQWCHLFCSSFFDQTSFVDLASS